MRVLLILLLCHLLQSEWFPKGSFWCAISTVQAFWKTRWWRFQSSGLVHSSRCLASEGGRFLCCICITLTTRSQRPKSWWLDQENPQFMKHLKRFHTATLAAREEPFFFGMFFLGEIWWNTWHKGREGKTKAFCWGQNGHLRWHLKKIIVARLDWCWSKAKLLTLSCSSDQAAAAFAVWPNLLMAPWWNRQQMFYEQSLDCRDFHCEISIFTRFPLSLCFGRTYFAEIISAKFFQPPPDRQGACKRKGLQQRQLLPARSTRSCRLFTAVRL